MQKAIVQHPVRLTLPRCGVVAAESIHDPSFRMQHEAHPFHELFYVYRGELHLELAGAEAPLFLPCGSIALVPRDTRHRLLDRRQSTLFLLALSPSFLARFGADAVWDQLILRKHLPLQPPQLIRQRFEQSFRRIIHEQVSTGTGAELLIQAETMQILVSLSRLPDAPEVSGAAARVDRVIAMLEETSYEPWELDDAARLAHLSRRRFSALVRDRTGHSFLELRNQLRLRHAAFLMREGGQSIAGAAFSSGFGDLAHFYRLFRRHYGMPPARWLKDTPE